jgi:hypothetical protein
MRQLLCYFILAFVAFLRDLMSFFFEDPFKPFIIIFDLEGRFLKAFLSILSFLLAFIVIVFMFLQSSKALFPIWVTELGMVTFLSFLYPLKALGLMVNTYIRRTQ